MGCETEFNYFVKLTNVTERQLIAEANLNSVPHRHEPPKCCDNAGGREVLYTRKLTSFTTAPRSARSMRVLTSVESLLRAPEWRSGLRHCNSFLGVSLQSLVRILESRLYHIRL
jgi:hypothetical protein